MKIRVGLFFGGNSVEHEISVITGLQAAEYIDKEKYEVVPVYITKDNRFYTGEETGKIENYKDIPALLKRAVRVLPVRGERGAVNLIRYPAKGSATMWQPLLMWRCRLFTERTVRTALCRAC